jgi:PAS domain S-box-containing protein
VWDWDLLAGVVVYSEQYRELLGYDEHEWPNRSDTWANHLHPDDWENARNAIDDYIAGRAPIYSTEHRLLCKDGSWKWFVDRGAVVENDAEGNPLRMVGTLIDLTERKQAEIALREAQTRMELATAAAGLGIFEFDVSSRLFSFDAQTAVNYVLANGARTMTFGEWMSIVHADDANRVRRELVWMRENGVSGRIEFRIRRRDGEVRWILADYLVRRDARGEMLSVLGTNLDTTDRRRAEAVAREASERLAIATQAAGIGVWECDADLNEPIWNDQMYTLFGYLPDALVTPLRVFNEAVRIDHGNEVRRRLFECARKGVPYEYEFQITRGDGMVRWIAARGTLRRDAEGRPLSILGANWDVTESRSARAALEEITARMRLATAATGIGIWSHDRNTGEMYWDDQLYRLFGRDAADGQTPDQVWAEAVPRADQKRVRVNQTHAVNKRVPYSHEFTVIWPDGSERRIAARGSVLDGPDGSLRMIGVNWDVTEQRRAEQTLLAKDAAEQASRAKSEFLSRMSHELRTPLNAILGFAQLLLLDATEALSGEQRNRLDRIQVAGWHLLELINEVLDLTRIEAGAVKLGNEPIVVGDLVSECMDLILPQAQNAGLALATDTARADGMIVVADRTRLKQVLLNLLSNAIKYNFAGGSITVGVARGADSTVDIYVKDTGRGMTEVQLSRLYEPFDRLGVDTTGIEGTGIGLAISRRLVELMKGSIDVTSEAGVGSEFRVKLPRAPANAIPRIRNTDTSPQVPAVPETEFKATVLYIEDNPLNRLLIEQYLMLRPAWTLVHAEDGSSGVALARVLQPDLTLVDINLPDLDGFEVVRRLQSDPLTHGLKFIALSANAMPQDIERASDAGFEDYWTKPIAVEDFLTRLDAWSAERLGRAR